MHSDKVTACVILFTLLAKDHLTQALAVHLQYHVIHAKCQIISGSDLISIFELIQNITASFSFQKKRKT